MLEAEGREGPDAAANAVLTGLFFAQFLGLLYTLSTGA